MGSSSSKEGTKIGGSVAFLQQGHLPKKDLSVLIRSGRSRGMSDVLKAIKKDYGEDKAAIVSESVHREINIETLSLSGYKLMAMPARQHYSRMRNLKADSWERSIHQDADAFVYFVHIDETAKYLGDDGYGRGGDYRFGYGEWEGDRFEISMLLRKPELVENPRKPLLLLVNNDRDDEFDVERLANLFGLGGHRFGRPFRAVLYSDLESDTNDSTLKESLEWLAEMVCSSQDEETAMTGSDTEDEGSIITSTTTGTAVSSTCGGHYVLDYEPTLLGGNPTLQRFQPIKNGTHCPFARAAKLWGGKLADNLKPRLTGHLDTVQEAASLNAGPLTEFVARSNNGEPLDGFCLELPGASYISPEHLGEKVRILLTKLAELDPSPGENAMKMGTIDHPHWRFRFAGEDFFLTVFSPTYGKDSSRYSFGVKKSFVLFQPRASFGRHGLNEDTPASATNWDNPTSMRDKARVAFKENGRPYYIPEELPYPVAEHIVKPAKDDGTTCIRWWEPLETKRASNK
jgi:hypothetical protein